MASFRGYDFSVVPESGFFPGIDIDDEGLGTYDAEIVCDYASREGLMESVAIVTPKRIHGTRSFNFHMEVGNVYTLVVPDDAGATYSNTAALVSLDCRGNGKKSDEFVCQASWIYTSTPQG